MRWIATFAAWLVSPLGTSLLLAIAALALAATRRARLAVASGALAVLWLWAFSLPVVSAALRGSVEAAYPPLPLQALPAAPAAVVLGGAIATPSATRPFPRLTDSSDRIWHAARLQRAGKAPLLVLSGGSDLRTEHMSEAAAMRLFLLDLGVPETALLLEEHSRTTSENARFSAALLRERGIDSVLLVTSAFHMSRALREFEAAGLRVIPVAVDHGDPPRWGAADAWMPDAGALKSSAWTMKEWLGMAVARMRGV